jgi:hypothetical protein
MAEQLITISDIQALKPRLSINIVSSDIIDQMIIDAQRLDIRPAIGSAFYYELVTQLNASPITSSYSDLFNGTTYARSSDGLTVDYFGLKPALVNYSFARILENLNMFFTRSGTKYKDTDTSTRVDNSQLVSWVNTARSQAISYMNGVNDYLCDNQSTFTIWTQDCQVDRSRSVQTFANKRNPTNIRTPQFFKSRKY